MKKALKITGISLGVLLLLLFTAPYLFKDQIKARVEKAINDNLNATFSVKEVDMSLLRHFPQAQISLTDLAIVNKAPFAGDTLVHFGRLDLHLSLMELFNGSDQPMNIKGIDTENGLVNIIFNQDGIGNFDIALKKEAEQPSEAGKPLALKIQQYAIRNYRIRYTDQRSGMQCQVDSLFHEGTGDFTQNRVDLNTTTSALVSVTSKGTPLLYRTAMRLEALLDADMAQKKYTFGKNEFKINELPLQFEGFVQMAEGFQRCDLRFKTPTASFKNALALIPKAYAGPIEGVQTQGNFSVNGFVKGNISPTQVPVMNIELSSKDASFHYPNLPKSIEHINIDVHVMNPTGQPADTYVALDQLQFQIDRDVFGAKAHISQLSTSPQVAAQLKGIINLANFAKAYPVKVAQPLSGVLKADVKTLFNMQAVETKNYAAIDNSGSLDLTDFNYAGTDGKKMRIERAMLQFTTSRVQLQQLQLRTGQSDLDARGTLDNLYGFLFRNQKLQGKFDLNAKQLVLADFMSTTEAKAGTPDQTTTTPAAAKGPAQGLKIPAFLDCTVTAKAQKVVYDDLTLQNTSGALVIQNQAATLKNCKTQLFDGVISFDGQVDTAPKTPTFDMDLGLQNVDIPQTFGTLKVLKKVAPVAEAMSGRLNGRVALSGPLNPKTLAPDTNLITGDLSGLLKGASVSTDKSSMLRGLGGKLSFLQGKSLSLNDVKADMHFEKGRVTIKPFSLKVQDFKAQIGGTHGFDQSMQYDVALEVPAKYLGPELGALASKLSANDLAKAGNLPINATLTGTFSQPKVSTDLKAAASQLAKGLVAQQKDKLIQQGAGLLDGLLNKNKKEGDTTKTKAVDNLKNKANDLLNGLFKK